MDLSGVNQIKVAARRHESLIPNHDQAVNTKKEFPMLETIIVVLLILWLVGFFGGGRAGIPRTGNLLHILLIIAVVLLIIRLL
jgi:hypothetical protein